MNLFLKFFETDLVKSANNLILKCDNCVAQNKNWLFFSNLIIIINCDIFKPRKLIIDYLEKGHTHMTADTVHGNITSLYNKNMRIYDFDDFKQIVKKSRKNIELIDVKHNDIIIFKNQCKKNIKLKICDIKSIKIVKNDPNLYVKTSHSNSDYEKFEILEPTIADKIINKKINYFFDNLQKQTEPAGITLDKFNSIAAEFSLMPKKSIDFYKSLKITDKIVKKRRICT